MPTITTITALGVFVDGSAPINYQPTVQTKHVVRGADTKVRCTVRNSAGTLVDLTDAACTLSVKQFEDDPSPLISRLGTVVDAEGGIVDFELSSNDTVLIGAGSYVWDMVVVFGDGNRSQVVPVSNFFVDPSANNPSLMPTIQLPSQQGQEGKFIGTDGTNLQWENAEGTFNPRGPWVSGLAYSVNDIVTSAGSTFRCKLDIDPSNTAPGSDATHFEVWAAKGDVGPAPAGGADGDVIVRVAGEPVWQGLGAAFRFVQGGAQLTPTNTWVELARITPGVNKQGSLNIFLRGTSNLPSKLSAIDQLTFRTDGAGRVFIQSPAIAPMGGDVPTYSGAGRPTAPSGLSAVVSAGNVALSFTPNAGSEGVFTEYSTDGGATWTRITSAYLLTRPPLSATSVNVPVDNGEGLPANTSLKLRATAFNDLGETASTPLDVDTENTGGGGNGSGQPISPYFPIRAITYNDLGPTWFHLAPPNAGSPAVEIMLTPDVPPLGSVETDLVLKARATTPRVGGCSFRIDFSAGPTI